MISINHNSETIGNEAISVCWWMVLGCHFIMANGRKTLIASHLILCGTYVNNNERFRIMININFMTIFPKSFIIIYICTT